MTTPHNPRAEAVLDAAEADSCTSMGPSDVLKATLDTAGRPVRVRRAIFSRLVGFGLLPMVALIGSVLLVPLLTRTVGPVGWGAIATGQALGAVGATVVQFGWAVVGPARVATLNPRAARGLYFTSSLMRAALYLLVTPVLIVTTWFVVPREWFGIAAMLCASVGLGGMTSTWFYIGRGLPRGLLALEVGPRLVFTAASAAVVAAGLPVWIYAVIALGSEIAIALGVIVVNARPDRDRRGHLAEMAAAFRAQWALALSNLLALGYQRAAVPIVAAASAAAAPLYATSDRAQAYARLPLGPVVQALQRWAYEVPSTGSTSGEFRRRVRWSVTTVTALGSVFALVLLALLPPLSGAFFGERLQLGLAESAPISVSIFAIGFSLALTTFILVPLDAVRIVTTSGIVASLVAAPGVWVAAHTAGAAGALWVVAAAEVGVAVAQALAARRSMSTLRGPLPAAERR